MTDLELNPKTKIYIAGHKGLVGSAVWRLFSSLGFENLIGMTSAELDLRNQYEVERFFEVERPEVVIDSAARVGGILANHTRPYEFLMDNLKIQCNLIDAAHRHDAKKFIFLGSSCIYPRVAPQPIKEDYLLTSSLEPTNEWYGIAKISGVKSCEAIRREFGKDFVSLMPSNLYGPNDNFDLETAHVLPALIRKFHEAKVNDHGSVTVWGSGTPMREFLHADDIASAVMTAVENVLPEGLYNVGFGEDISIKDLATIIQEVTGHRGEIIWDSSKPDGTPRKVLDISRLKNIGWKPQISLREGIKSTYDWFVANHG
jgi:GDP-L-fucose synthase